MSQYMPPVSGIGGTTVVRGMGLFLAWGHREVGLVEVVTRGKDETGAMLRYVGGCRTVDTMPARPADAPGGRKNQ